MQHINIMRDLVPQKTEDCTLVPSGSPKLSPPTLRCDNFCHLPNPPRRDITGLPVGTQIALLSNMQPTNLATQKTEVCTLADTALVSPLSPSARAFAAFGTIGFEVYLATVATQYTLRLAPLSPAWDGL